MDSLLWSYLGSHRFPQELSILVWRFFTLSGDDRLELRRRFRSRSRLGAALQATADPFIERVLAPPARPASACTASVRSSRRHRRHRTAYSVTCPSSRFGKGGMTCCVWPPRSMRGGARPRMCSSDSAVLRGDRIYQAGHALGQLLRTVYLCDYFALPDFRSCTTSAKAVSPFMPCSDKFALSRYRPSAVDAPRS